MCARNIPRLLLADNSSRVIIIQLNTPQGGYLMESLLEGILIVLYRFQKCHNFLYIFGESAGFFCGTSDLEINASLEMVSSDEN